MAMGAASILLTMVSLQTLLLLVAAGTSAAAVSGGTTIRLPSDAREVADDARQAAAAVVADDDDDDDGGKRPWECCDLGVCTMSMPPICRCYDKVDRCSHACKQCEETEDSRHVCFDTYRGDPGPRCHGSRLADAGRAVAAVMAAAYDKKEKQRPWKCCDVPICTRSYPPICRCADTVERCASTCERCEQVEERSGGGAGGGPRYRCLDPHQGDPGPSCRGGGDHDWARMLAARGRRF